MYYFGNYVGVFSRWQVLCQNDNWYYSRTRKRKNLVLMQWKFIPILKLVIFISRRPLEPQEFGSLGAKLLDKVSFLQKNMRLF